MKPHRFNVGDIVVRDSKKHGLLFMRIIEVIPGLVGPVLYYTCKYIKPVILDNNKNYDDIIEDDDQSYREPTEKELLTLKFTDII